MPRHVSRLLERWTNIVGLEDMTYGNQPAIKIPTAPVLDSNNTVQRKA